MANAPAAVYETALQSLPLLHRGKVRDVYAAGDEHLLIVTTDRLSAFDVVMPNPIPGKGRVLHGISEFWFDQTAGIIPNHRSARRLEELISDPSELALLEGRAAIVKRLQALPIEAVVRGYLSGSGWKDYQKTGAVCGHPLPAGLRLADALPEPIFTPATKAAAGAHDENIDFATVVRLIGEERARAVRDTAVAIYRHASVHARARGIIIADTKFEFGVDDSGALILIDEVLTPDSSRFWPAATWRPGASPPSFDKQFVRDYLETLDWDKRAPGPRLPEEVVARTAEKYAEALVRLTGPPLAAPDRCVLIWERFRAHFEQWLFAPVGTASRRERVRGLAQYPYALLRDLLSGQLNIHANGLVFATVLALVPLIAFSFAVLRGFGAQRELEPLVYEFFLPMGSAAGEITQKVMNFADRVRGGLLGSVGLTFLIWTLIGTLKRVEDSLNFVWHVEHPRSFMRRIAEYFALLVIAPVLIGALVGMAKLTSGNSSVQMLAHLPLLGGIARALLALVPVLLVSGVFAVIYALIPNTRVQQIPALIGGLAAGILWTAIGRVFTGFVQVSTHLTIVYAGFAIFIAALVWIYLSWLILLLGAQLSFYVQNPSYLRIGLREPRLSNAESEQLALSVMYLVARSHQQGSERWSVNTLAARLALPGVAVARMVRALEAGGLLVTTEHETLLPGRNASRIPLREIVTIARTTNSVHGDDRTDAPAPVKQLCVELEGLWLEHLDTKTLEAWVSAGS